MVHNEDQSGEEGYSIGGASVRLIDREAVKAIWDDGRETQKREAEAFPNLMARLRSILQTYYPPHLIAVMAGWVSAPAPARKG